MASAKKKPLALLEVTPAQTWDPTIHKKKTVSRDVVAVWKDGTVIWRAAGRCDLAERTCGAAAWALWAKKHRAKPRVSADDISAKRGKAAPEARVPMRLPEQGQIHVPQVVGEEIFSRKVTDVSGEFVSWVFANKPTVGVMRSTHAQWFKWVHDYSAILRVEKTSKRPTTDSEINEMARQARQSRELTDSPKAQRKPPSPPLAGATAPVKPRPRTPNGKAHA